MIFFIGDKPSSVMKPGAKPFQGAACEKRLQSWIAELNIADYVIINQADYTWKQLALIWYNEGVIFIALGNNASKTVKSLPHFKLPHPSGLNRQINDKEFIKLRLNECSLYIRRAQGYP